MRDPRDIVDIDGLRSPPPEPVRIARPFLSIWFRCCHTYGRLYRNRDKTRYEGRCPTCGGSVHAVIGPSGSSRRMFEAE